MDRKVDLNFIQLVVALYRTQTFKSGKLFCFYQGSTEKVSDFARDLYSIGHVNQSEINLITAMDAFGNLENAKVREVDSGLTPEEIASINKALAEVSLEREVVASEVMKSDSNTNTPTPYEIANSWTSPPFSSCRKADEITVTAYTQTDTSYKPNEDFFKNNNNNKDTEALPKPRGDLTVHIKSGGSGSRLNAGALSFESFRHRGKIVNSENWTHIGPASEYLMSYLTFQFLFVFYFFR